MATATFPERIRLASLVAARQCRRIAHFLTAPVRMLGRFRAGAPDRLLIAPQDIRTADATRAEDIYAGYFAFGGRLVNTQGRSPFDLPPPSREWKRALDGFGWLRHLRAANTALARVNARALVDDYLAVRGRQISEADQDPATVARRLLSWLSQSPIVLAGADSDFYHRYLKAMARDAFFLQQSFSTHTDSAQLVSAIALAEYALCTNATSRQRNRATAQLAGAIAQQILPDGGHISRSPQILVDLLLDFLPLRQAYSASNIAPPPELLNAIDRIMPLLRLLRHGDGSLALFNGMGVTAPDWLAIVLAYDDTRSAPLTKAPDVGYFRLEAQDAVIIVDGGGAPPRHFSVDAHAGCLSFEFSDGLETIIVNCGAPPLGRVSARQAARHTAAHSTLTIDNVSSCRIAPEVGLEKIVAGQILSGSRRVIVKQSEMSEGLLLELSHDGYVRRFGLMHERRLALKSGGDQLVGEDRLLPVKDGGKRSGQVSAICFAARFHLHPSVTTQAAEDGASIVLETPSGRQWLFEAGGLPLVIEESVFFAAPDGVRASEQIVLYGDIIGVVELQWALSLL